MAEELIRRAVPLAFELRQDGSSANLEGYASTFSQPYDMGAFREEVLPGAFTRSLSQAPDVRFLVDHQGTPLARTKSGTLDLAEDSTGLHVRASLDLANPAAQTIVSAVSRGDMDSMSFAFRVAKGGDSWSEDYSHRQLKVVTINNGDVSVVTHPANPGTTIGLRAEDEYAATVELVAAMTYELRAGRVLSATNLTRLRDAVDALVQSRGAHDTAVEHLDAVITAADPYTEAAPELLAAPTPEGMATSIARRRLELIRLRRPGNAA